MLNILSHAIGLVLSMIALPLLVNQAVQNGNVLRIVSYSIFAGSLILLYAASTLYHSAKKPEVRRKLNIIDHACIYLLIAGTYTPFTLVTLNGTTGWIIFGISWGLALTGIILKLFFTGSYDLFSTMMYILMGWVILFAIKPIINNLPIEGFLWLLTGGISYTFGALFYSLNKVKFNHFIFHIFVLLGSFCHFMSVFFYV